MLPWKRPVETTGTAASAQREHEGRDGGAGVLLGGSAATDFRASFPQAALVVTSRAVLICCSLVLLLSPGFPASDNPDSVTGVIHNPSTGLCTVLSPDIQARIFRRCDGRRVDFTDR
jgi:hypothetical protein